MFRPGSLVGPLLAPNLFWLVTEYQLLKSFTRSNSALLFTKEHNDHVPQVGLHRLWLLTVGRIPLCLGPIPRNTANTKKRGAKVLPHGCQLGRCPKAVSGVSRLVISGMPGLYHQSMFFSVFFSRCVSEATHLPKLLQDCDRPGHNDVGFLS